MFDEKLYNINLKVDQEFHRATKLFGPFASAHEGYAILLEEVDELWDVVKWNNKEEPEYNKGLKQEAIQVAAMALRFLYDLCEWEEKA